METLDIKNDMPNNMEIEKKQKNFLQTRLGKAINSGLNIGLRYALPDIIEDEIIKYADSKLILLMLGPTAKVVVGDLVAQIPNQMIDIGHIDSEYEWMKMGATTKVKIPHKHTAEFNFDDSQIKLEDDQDFDQQIISTIE